MVKKGRGSAWVAQGEWVKDQIASFQLKQTVVVLKCPVS